MYSFGPLPRQKRSGRVIGTHQKIDRVARRHLTDYLDEQLPFPDIRTILHFEGLRGPDGIKLKSPGRDEPWHFIDPNNPYDDDRLLVALREHRENLISALRQADMVRAAFEAAWLAHVVADGLTPAHHEPYEEHVQNIKNDTKKVRDKIIMSGKGSHREFIRNNWQHWGAKGVLTTHTLFEAGVATTAKPLRFTHLALSTREIEKLNNEGFETLYLEMLDQIASLNMYAAFKRRGWTQTLARQTTQTLLPTVIRAVILAWYDAYAHAVERSS